MKRGLHESVKTQQVVAPETFVAAETTYNNCTQAAASGIDTQGYDELMIELSLGVIASGTLDVDIFDSATDDATVATIITDSAGTEADFDQKSAADSGGNETVRIRAKDVKRYVFVKVTNSSSGSKALGINALLGEADGEPVSQDRDSDFTHDVA